MGIVIPFPKRQVLDEELSVQLWELVMAGELDSPEYARLSAEIERRKARGSERAVANARPWR